MLYSNFVNTNQGDISIAEYDKITEAKNIVKKEEYNLNN